MGEPRAMTKAEMLDVLMGGIRDAVEYWSSLPDVEIQRGRPPMDAAGLVRERCDGVAFSILTLLDGSTLAAPAFSVVPRPHAEDADYHEEHAENWWPAPTEGQESTIEALEVSPYPLHEAYCMWKREEAGNG